MTGGIIQLVSKSVEDVYLIDDPNITFFKTIYRKHTNFSVESIGQLFDPPLEFGKKTSCVLGKLGDLIGKMVLSINIPAIPKFMNGKYEDPIKKVAWVPNLGFALIQEMSIEIGDTIITKQYGEFMYIWSQLSNEKESGLSKMIGNVPELTDFTNGKPAYTLHIPLDFWFCKISGSYLPIAALMENVKINITISKLENCLKIIPTHSIQIIEPISPFNIGDEIYQTVDTNSIIIASGHDYLTNKLYYNKLSNQSSLQSYQKNKINDWTTTNRGFNPNLGYHKKQITTPAVTTNFDNKPYRIYKKDSAHYVTPFPDSIEIEESVTISPILGESVLYVDYVYLDSNERQKYISGDYEYLIEQLQYTHDANIVNNNIQISLPFNHPCKSIYWVAQTKSLQKPFNSYPFQYTIANQPIILSSELFFENKSRTGVVDNEYYNLVFPYQHHTTSPQTGINVYSYSIYPEKHQPSSTLNLSVINNSKIQLRLNKYVSSQNSATVKIYTINYNILKISLRHCQLLF